MDFLVAGSGGVDSFDAGGDAGEDFPGDGVGALCDFGGGDVGAEEFYFVAGFDVAFEG